LSRRKGARRNDKNSMRYLWEAHATRKYPDRIEDLNFCISSHGRIWDICVACSDDLERWMTIRRAEESEGT